MRRCIVHNNSQASVHTAPHTCMGKPRVLETAEPESFTESYSLGRTFSSSIVSKAR